LDALGLIRFEAVTGFAIKFAGEPRFPCHYYGRPHILSTKSAIQLDIGKTLLTDVGRELAVIAGSTPVEEYRSWVVTTIREKGWEVLEGQPIVPPPSPPP
jgi:hypothetical protein